MNNITFWTQKKFLKYKSEYEQILTWGEDIEIKSDEILYVNGTKSQEVNNFIEKNIDWIQKLASESNLENAIFIHPIIPKSDISFKKSLQYSYPFLDSSKSELIEKDLISLSAADFTKTFLHSLGFEWKKRSN